MELQPVADELFPIAVLMDELKVAKSIFRRRGLLEDGANSWLA